MALYRARAVFKRTNAVQESEPTPNLNMAEVAADKFLRNTNVKVLLILRDSEGEDHPANAGKFFLHRIIK